MELWRDPTCAASLTAAALRGGALFADFVGAVLNDLMYLLKDSLAVRACMWGVRACVCVQGVTTAGRGANAHTCPACLPPPAAPLLPHLPPSPAHTSPSPPLTPPHPTHSA